jgi:hypothetical protein
VWIKEDGGMKKHIVRLLLVFVISLPLVIWAKEKRQLSNEEKETAFNMAVRYISAMLKAPSTAHFCSIEESRFKAKGKTGVSVDLWVDAQNSDGAMLRKVWSCQVDTNSRSLPVLCYERD